MLSIGSLPPEHIKSWMEVAVFEREVNTLNAVLHLLIVVFSDNQPKTVVLKHLSFGSILRNELGAV